MTKQRIILPGDGEKPTGDASDPTIVIEEGIREITQTDLGDQHAPKHQLRGKIDAETEDWGDGFNVYPEQVLIQRNPDGSIARTIPLSEIPGVTTYDKDAPPVEADEVPTPVPLSTSDREKLVGILTNRLYNYYWDRGPGDPRFNPFRDGIPELPAGSPEHLQPLPGTPLYPATGGQVRDYLRRFIADRVTVINKNRFGSGIEDLALRIQ